MLHIRLRKTVCAAVALAVAVGPLLAIPRAAHAQSPPQSNDNPTVQLPWVQDAQSRARQRYEACKSMAVRRAFEYSAKVASLGYTLRPNLALHLELIKAIGPADLVLPGTGEADENALFLYERSVETAVLSLSWGARSWSNINQDDVKQTAAALYDHLGTLYRALPAGAQKKLYEVVAPIYTRLDLLRQGGQARVDDESRREIKRLRNADPGTAAELALELGDGITAAQVEEWKALETSVAEAEKSVDKPNPTEAEIEQYHQRLDRFLKSTVTQKILQKAGVKDAKKVQAAASCVAGVILNGANLIARWDKLNTPQKALEVSKLLVGAGLAIQAFMSASTAGVKTGILLLLVQLLDFIDLGINLGIDLFPGGGKKNDGGGEGEGKGQGPGAGKKDEKSEKSEKPGGGGAPEPEPQRHPEDKGSGFKGTLKADKPCEAKPSDGKLEQAQKKAKDDFNKKLDDAKKKAGTEKEKKEIETAKLPTTQAPKHDFEQHLKERGIDPDKDLDKAAALLNEWRDAIGEALITNVPPRVKAKADALPSRSGRGDRSGNDPQP